MEDQIQELIDLQKKYIEDQARIDQDVKGELDRINSTLSELVQNMMHVDLLIDEEPMAQQLNDEPSHSEVEQEPSPKELKECILPMISISLQHTPSGAKISFLLPIPTCREVPSFVSTLDTRPTIIFKPTYIMAELLAVVDYTTFHGRKLLFEHLP